MDILLEIVFEIAFEGVVTLGTSRRVPTPVRIIATVFISALYLFILGALALITVGLFRQTQYIYAFVMLALDVLLVSMLVKGALKYYRDRRG